MKISKILLGVICSVFLTSIQDVYSMKRHRLAQKTQTSRNKKIQKMETDILQSDQQEELEAQGIEEYIKSRPKIIKELLFQAEMHFNTNNIGVALPIYEKIVSKCNDPLALFRIGEIYEKMAEDNPIMLTKSFEYFKLALNNGFVMALQKLLEIGEALNQIVKESQTRPMSFEVQQMYM